MLRFSAAIVVLCAIASPAWADGEAPPQTPANPSAVNAAARIGRFQALVAKAERERRAGRVAEAAAAYAEAFELEHDPLVAGRLGVLLVELGSPAEAADLLLDAIDRATDAPAAERQGFLTAYDKARSEVCRVEVDISEAHTSVALDGVVNQPDAVTGFTMFIPAGEHELRASLSHFEDGVSHFTAWKGGKLRVTLTLLPLPTFKPIEPPVRMLRRFKLDQREEREAVRSAEDPPADEPEQRDEIQGGVEGAQRSEKEHVTVGVGPVVVFGVASWQPAVGAVASVNFRPKEYFSLGIEGRAAWLTSGVKGEPINAMTAGGIASACGHWRWLFGCALGYVGTVNVDFSGRSYEEKSYAFVQPGGGARVGANVRIGSWFVVQGAVDALALSRGMTIVAAQKVLVDQGPFMFGSQIVGGWEF